jgi:hypothetical protein
MYCISQLGVADWQPANGLSTASNWLFNFFVYVQGSLCKEQY